MKRLLHVFVSCCVMVTAASTYGQDLFSFTDSDLDGDFSIPGRGLGDGLFTAVDDGDTDGDVTRKVAPAGTALFAGTLVDGGFPGAASFDLTMDIFITGPGTADGSGELTLTDLDGDTITGVVEGQWFQNDSANFAGSWTGIQITDNGTLDGMFDGTDGSVLISDFAGGGPFNGNIITLVFQNWFADGQGTPQTFQDASTFASGAIVPEPATLGLLALGGLGVLYRRRRH